MELIVLSIVWVLIFSGVAIIFAQFYGKIKMTRNRVGLGIFLVISGVIVNAILVVTMLG